MDMPSTVRSLISERLARIGRWTRLLCVLVALFVGACSHPAEKPTPANTRAVSPALSRDEEGVLVASQQSARFKEFSADCGRPSEPAVLCSGVLLRGTAYSPAYHSWAPNPNSTKGDGVSFSFLRRGAVFRRLAFGYTHGFVTYPPLHAPPSLYRLEVLCTYPLDSNSDNRVESGCGYNKVYPAQSGPCQAQGIVTAAQWLAHFRQGASSHQYQCGFTLRIGTKDSASAFMAMTEAMRINEAPPQAENNEVIVRSWKDRPNAIGIESFFYLDGTTGLADSQREQRDFYTTIGVWRPLIRMTLPTNAASDAIFTYDASEQGVPAGAHEEEGRSAAADLQGRFDAVNDADPLNARCNGSSTPVFLCSGIILRGTSNFSDQFHAWNPSPTSPKNGGVSFSYLRKDASFEKLAYDYTHGFIFWPVFHHPVGKFDAEVLCYFPMDADTDRRSEFGCGPHVSHPSESVPCQQKGPPIVTGAAWLAHYNAAGSGVSKRERSCGFTMASGTPNSAAIFKEGIHIVGSLLPRGAFFYSQDEMIVAKWDEGSESTIPLEAFFYVKAAGLAESRKDQQDFFTTGGIWRPVIKVTLPSAAGAEATFDYGPGDQAIP